MSEKSYQIKENNQVMIQGGEKKVMKKILSVALSTAMAFSMFASVAFGDDTLTPQQKFDILKEEGIFTGYPDGTAGLDKEMTRAEFAKVLVELLGLEPVQGKLSFKDAGYTANNWAVPYIEAVYAAGIMEGKNTTKMIFDYNGNITVQEMAKVLVVVQNLDIPTETNNNASNWAKGYVQAAINAGLINNSVNPLANASRTQLVEVAYAIYLAQNKPKVASYDVQEDGKVVEFTLANSEKVKVTLETPLKANVATEVKFTYNNYEYTETVTWEVTVATKVDSVSASNLKEIVVAFDGTVDKASAENKNNYSVKGNLVIDSAKVSEDNRSVTLLLAAESTLTNQTETEITLKNVKNSDSSRVFDQTVKFTPVDAAIPEVSEVVGLGTGAFKIVFSEPVKESAAIISNNYRVDGNVIGANVSYQYPNIVIVETGLTVGEHKVTVSNVEDFSGLKVAPVEKTFTIVEDTEAPTVASIKTNDLRQVEIEFNETIKSVDRIYANSTSNTASVPYTIRDNKVTVNFANPLNVNENTIYIEGVRDYSNNVANREAKVTPTLDTERPEVVKTELKLVDGKHQLVIEFSELVETASAESRANYTLKKSDGKAAEAIGLDSNGKPVIKPAYDAAKRTVTIDLADKLANGVYTLEVTGVRDIAYVPNQMLPYTTTINSSVATEGAISRVWKATVGTQEYVYVQYNKNVATSGVGDATSKQKYTVQETQGGAFRTLNNDESVVLYSPNTVRIAVTTNVYAVRANLIADTEGNFFTQAGNYILEKDVVDAKISLKADKNVEATDKNSVVLVFDGALNYVNPNDFTVTTSAGNYKPNTYSLSEDRTTLTLKFTGNNALPTDMANATITAADPTTRDNFGERIAPVNAPVVDKVAPEVDEETARISAPSTVSGVTYYDITFDVSESVGKNTTVTEELVNQLFTVKFGNSTAKVEGVTYGTATENIIVVRVSTDHVVAPTEIVSVAFDHVRNTSAKAIVDANGNAVGEFRIASQYQYID